MPSGFNLGDRVMAKLNYTTRFSGAFGAGFDDGCGPREGKWFWRNHTAYDQYICRGKGDCR